MEISEKDNVLASVKKMLGIDPEVSEFNTDILININSSVFVLSQLGVGPSFGYSITEETTYGDYLGIDKKNIFDPVAMYLVTSTKIKFDPPASSIVMEALKETKRELEWRLNISQEVREDE